MRSRLRKGEIAEALFISKVLSLGMNISKPFGQNCRYDFIVEVMGKAVRIQVKSTWMSRQPSALSGQENQNLSPRGTRRYTKEDTKGHEYVVRAGGTTTRGARRYRKSDVDYIAAYVGPEDEWYVIPVERIPSAFTIVLPGRYERYREAWDQLCPRGTYVGDIKACADPVVSRQSPVASEDKVNTEDAEDAEESIAAF